MIDSEKIALEARLHAHLYRALAEMGYTYKAAGTINGEHHLIAERLLPNGRLTAEITLAVDLASHLVQTCHPEEACIDEGPPPRDAGVNDAVEPAP